MQMPHARLAQLSILSVARGTHITMHDGQQAVVESLAPGDFVLTRHNGAQPVLWIAQAALFANVADAPVHFEPGSVRNAGALRTPPDLRLFLDQRAAKSGAAPRETLLCAGDLVGQSGICREAGGFVEYVQIALGGPQYVYVEGIPAECQSMDPAANAASHQQSTTRPELRKTEDQRLALPQLTHPSCRVLV